MTSGWQNQNSLRFTPNRQSTMGPEIGGSPGTPGSASIDTTSGELTTQAVSIGPRVLPVKITTWRLLNTVFLLAVGTAKAASAYRGDATVVNTLDWIIGVIWALVSYWFSILENESPNSIPWLLEYDIYEEGAIRVVIGYPLVFFLLIIVVSTISTVAMISVADLQEHAKGKTDTSGGYSTSFDIALMIGAAFLGLLVLIVGGIIVLVGLPFLFKQIVGLLWLPRMKRQLFLRSDWDVKDMWRKERMVTLILVVLIL
ncbi:hypothetical protein B0H34DRAFT_715884 [Crassisporium funariophilum]|nr:hypothetical protein B0H34DRAFT_715884 [Crassisporium funariophilum]